YLSSDPTTPPLLTLSLHDALPISAVGEQWPNLHAFCRANIRQDKNHGHNGKEHRINMGANWCERSLELSFGMWCFSHEASLDKNVVSRRCHGLNGPVHSCCPSRRHSP